MADLTAIKSIADNLRHDVGFVRRAALETDIASGMVLVSVDHTSQSVGAFVHFRHRLDGATKIYEICVSPELRRAGVGRALLTDLERRAAAKGQHTVILKCPEHSPANAFYQHCGYAMKGTVPGKARRLCEWQKSTRFSRFS